MLSALGSFSEQETELFPSPAGAQGFSIVPGKGLSVPQVQKKKKLRERLQQSSDSKANHFMEAFVSGRFLGSDKNYVSSEEGSRDPRKVSGVAVWASLRTEVSAIQ